VQQKLEDWQTLVDGLTYENCSEHEVRAELSRILQSPLFSQSERLGRFLRFTIDSVLAAKADSLKEYVIGTEVYDRKPPYHPSQDSIVRTEARRLRAKLKEYYESEGREDPVFIYFRPGTYIPVFRRNEAAGAAPSSQSSGDLLIKGSGVPVAVLPFADLSNRPLSSLCAQGVSDEITHHLALTDGIRVVSSASVTQLIAAPYDIPSLSQKLGVLNIIEGTVREEHNRLRITARVLSSDGFQLSSHRFETAAEPESLLQVQEQIATAFVSRSRPEISYIRKRKATPGALTFVAYPLVMYAETLLDEGSASDLQSALLKFEEASEVAPTYARPYCGISQCSAEVALRGTSSSSELVTRAKVAALKAIELDPEMIDSYACLGSAQALDWDWSAAEQSFAHGIQLGLHVSSSRRYAMFLAALMRFDEALHHLEMAQRIDPFSNRQKVAQAKFQHITRRYSEGVSELSERFMYGPFPVEARFLLALMSAHLGDRAKARQLIESVRPDSGAQLPMMAGVAEILALIGEMDEANQIVNAFNLLSLDARISRFRQALLALALGNKRDSLSLLTQAVNDREAELLWLRVEPRFDPIRGEPAFADLLHTVFPHGYI
jgi:TolB-like protein/tetratricopeptide (TPR) repeat protein